jgi:hypothetical protein
VRTVLGLLLRPSSPSAACSDRRIPAGRNRLRLLREESA